MSGGKKKMENNRLDHWGVWVSEEGTEEGQQLDLNKKRGGRATRRKTIPGDVKTRGSRGGKVPGFRTKNRQGEAVSEKNWKTVSKATT